MAASVAPATTRPEQVVPVLSSLSGQLQPGLNIVDERHELFVSLQGHTVDSTRQGYGVQYKVQDYVGFAPPASDWQLAKWDPVRLAWFFFLPVGTMWVQAQCLINGQLAGRTTVYNVKVARGEAAIAWSLPASACVLQS